MASSLQGMSRAYEWLTPLSANFLPVSDSYTILAYASPSAASSVTPSTSSPAFRLTFAPLFPTGAVLYGDKLEWLLHRSHAVDDEKGLEEALRDPSRGRFLLRMRDRSSSHGDGVRANAGVEDRSQQQREREWRSSREAEIREQRQLVVISGVDHRKYLQPM
jgi:hypothetical protein